MSTFPIVGISIGLILVALLAVVFVTYRRKGELPKIVGWSAIMNPPAA